MKTLPQLEGDQIVSCGLPAVLSRLDLTVPYNGLAVIEMLSGQSSGIEDPFDPMISGLVGHDLQDHQAQVMDGFVLDRESISKNW